MVLHQVSERVLVCGSSYCTTNTAVVLGPRGSALLVDPGVTPAELDDLAAALRRRGLTVVAGIATHPHWDHVLWHRDWAGVPRYAAGVTAGLVAATQDRLVRQAEDAVPGAGANVRPGLTGLTGATGRAQANRPTRVPWNGPCVLVHEHSAHAPGHLAVLIASDAVLLAGDMLSDLEIPLLDRDAADPVGDYLRALDLFEDRFAGPPALRVVVPGHGSPGDGAALRQRLAADRAYLQGLTGPGDPSSPGDPSPLGDPRLGPAAAGWLIGEHQANQNLARGEMS